MLFSVIPGTFLIIPQLSPSIVLNCSLAGKDQQDRKQADYGKPSDYEARGKAKVEKSNRSGWEG